MRLALPLLVGATLLIPARALAQASQVSYEVTERATIVATPSARARAIAQIDSGTMIAVDWTEELGPAYARVVWNGRQGWIVNSAIRRIVAIRDTVQVRVRDTVRVTRSDTVVRIDTVRRQPRTR